VIIFLTTASSTLLPPSFFCVFAEAVITFSAVSPFEVIVLEFFVAATISFLLTSFTAMYSSVRPMRPPVAQRKHHGASAQSFLGFIECWNIRSAHFLFSSLNDLIPKLP